MALNMCTLCYRTHHLTANLRLHRQLFRRAYVFHGLFKWHLRRVLTLGDPESAEFKMAPVKKPERVYLKIIRSYNGDWSQVSDRTS